MPSHRLYVGTIGEGLFRSTDRGRSFQRAMDGMFVECHVRALAVHPRDDRILYLGCELGLFRSDNGADSWSPIPALEGKQVWSILIHPETPDLILAGTCPPRLFRSANAGNAWTDVTPAFRPDCARILWNRVTTLAADPTDAGKLWCGVEIDGLWHSRDRGHSWTRGGVGLSSQDIHALAIPPLSHGKRRLLAATNNDLNASDDDGLTWTPLGIGDSMPHSYCRTLASLLNRPDTVLLGNGDAPPGSTGVVGVSTDAGRSWKPAVMPGPANSTIWNFALHRSEPSLVYASSVSGLLFRSEDAGQTWSRLPREFGEIRALAWTP
jgi:hypothetical protein